MAATDRSSDRFMLRLPDGMRDRIKSSAARSGRSMNAEIISALEERYPEDIKLEELACMIRDRVKSGEYDSNTVINGITIKNGELIISTSSKAK